MINIIYIAHAIELIFKDIKYFYNFFLYIKMINDHYQTRKERRRKEERKRYQNLSEEEKTKGEKGPIKISKFN